MFITGMVLRERLVTLDDERRRLVWSIVDGPYNHHNGAVEVFADEDGGCRLVWTADLLPDREAERTSEFMDQGDPPRNLWARLPSRPTSNKPLVRFS